MTATTIAAALSVFVGLVAVADGPGIDIAKLEGVNAKVEAVTWKGAAAVKVTGLNASADDGLAMVKGATFRNGTIELDVAGLPGARASETARGFVGISFRIQDGTHLETFYIRPTNGRAEDQLRRNHSVQYVSRPDWPWEKLRQETPGVYETYADMQPGEWIHLKLVVKGRDAMLYVGNATQPTLLVHDLKLGDVEGGVALWIGPGTDGYFKNLRITPS